MGTRKQIALKCGHENGHENSENPIKSRFLSRNVKRSSLVTPIIKFTLKIAKNVQKPQF